MKKKRFLKKTFRIITTLFLLLVITLSALYAMRIKLLKALIETKGSTMNGALVEVEGLDNPLFTLDLTWDKLQVASKDENMKNKFEINNANFQLIPKPLLAGKVLIEELNVGEVVFDTVRTSSGELPEELKVKEKKKPVEKKKESLLVNNTKKYIEEKAKGKVEEVLAVDDFNSNDFSEKLVKQFDLKLEQEFKEAEATVKEKEKYWDNIIKERNYESRIMDLKSNYNNLNIDTSNLVSLFEKIKDFESFKKFEEEFNELSKEKKKIDTLITEGKTIVSDIEKDKKAFDKDFKELNKIKDNLAKSTEEDLKKIKSVGKMNNEQLGALTQELFGEKTSKLIMKLLDVYSKVSSVFGEKKAKEEVLVDEKMPELPKLWIKNTTVKVYSGNKFFDGNILNITDNQNKTKMPIEISIKNQESKTLTKVNSVIDYRGESDLKDIIIVMTGLELKNEDVGIANIEKADVEVNSNIKMSKGELKIRLDAELSNTEFSDEIKIADKKMKELMKEILEDLEYIKLSVGYEDKGSDKKYVFESNIDKIISEKLSALYQREIKAAEERAKKEIQKKIDEYRKQLVKDLEKLAEKNGVAISSNYKEALGSAGKISDVEKVFQGELNKLDAEKDKKLEDGKKQLEKEVQEKIQKEIEKRQKELEDKAKIEEEKKKQELENERKKAEEELKKQIEKEAKKIFNF